MQKNGKLFLGPGPVDLSESVNFESRSFDSVTTSLVRTLHKVKGPPEWGFPPQSQAIFVRKAAGMAVFKLPDLSYDNVP